MALGMFDETLRVEGWFDETALIGGWFDESLIQQESGSSTQTLTQSSRFDNAPTFYAHTLTPGAVGLIQSARHDNAATFYAHTLTPGAVALVQSARFDNDATFYTHTLSQAGGTQTLTQGATFENENAFFAHSLDQEDVTSSSPPFIGRGGGGYLVELDAKPIRETITLYDEEAEILELLAAIMPVIQEQQRRATT